MHACDSASTVISAASTPRRRRSRCADDDRARESSMNRSVALALCALLFAPLAAAQEWPTKPVRIIVPFGPGSTPDMVRRLLGDHMQQKLRQPFVVESRAPATTTTGPHARTQPA